jgi:hypothetical protein
VPTLPAPRWCRDNVRLIEEFLHVFVCGFREIPLAKSSRDQLLPGSACANPSQSTINSTINPAIASIYPARVLFGIMR